MVQQPVWNSSNWSGSPQFSRGNNSKNIKQTIKTWVEHEQKQHLYKLPNQSTSNLKIFQRWISIIFPQQHGPKLFLPPFSTPSCDRIFRVTRCGWKRLLHRILSGWLEDGGSRPPGYEEPSFDSDIYIYIHPYRIHGNGIFKPTFGWCLW